MFQDSEVHHKNKLLDNLKETLGIALIFMRIWYQSQFRSKLLLFVSMASISYERFHDILELPLFCHINLKQLSGTYSMTSNVKIMGLWSSDLRREAFVSLWNTCRKINLKALFSRSTINGNHDSISKERHHISRFHYSYQRGWSVCNHTLLRIVTKFYLQQSFWEVFEY